MENSQLKERLLNINFLDPPKYHECAFHCDVYEYVDRKLVKKEKKKIFYAEFNIFNWSALHSPIVAQSEKQHGDCE